jgi:hypothetical protein
MPEREGEKCGARSAHAKLLCEEGNPNATV